VFCHRPELMKLWADLQTGFRRNMAPRRFELATLAAALALRSSYCSLAHGTKLTDQFSSAELLAIVRDQEGAATSLSPAELALMRFAAAVAVDASAIRAEDVADLKAHGLSDAEVFDLAVTAAGRAFFSKIADALGVLPDQAYQAMEPALREALTVGRPVADEPSELCPAP
jgi:alkylhydroperoxidase family enzyme